MSAKTLSVKRGGVNMTEGNILRHIIKFAAPLLVGNIFQQMYNMVDTWVVGNYVSNEAFAAVGSVGSIINMLIGFFTGFSTGAGVVISQYYGAGDEKNVSRATHTAIAVTAILCVFFTVLGVFIAPYMVSLMKTPENVRGESIKYLTIYFLGITGLLVYNMGSAILRAVGDSQKPFYFILVSAVINTVFDLVFVLVFKMGVEGVAYATVIAQGVSAILVMISLFLTKNCIRLSLKKIAINVGLLIKIVKIGIPTAIQLMLTAFSNVFVQSYINEFGDNYMSAYTAYNKIDQILLAPIQAVSLAATTFVGQNLGIRNVDRAKRGFVTCILITLVTTVVMLIPVLIFAPNLVGFFNSKAEVIEYGAMFLRLISPFYLAFCVDMVFASTFRGAGNPKVTMIIMLTSYVAFRQIYLLIISNIIKNSIIAIIFAYPAGWLVAMIISLVYYKIKGLNISGVVTEEKSNT